MYFFKVRKTNTKKKKLEKPKNEKVVVVNT